MSGPLRLLLVDDDPADTELLRAYLEDAPFPTHIEEVGDGVEALEFLHAAVQAGRDLPHLVLLDINMPRKDGFETLRELRAEDALRDLKVIVLTTSSHDEDVVRSFDLEANYFVTKPAEAPEFRAVIQLIQDFASAYLPEA